MGRVLKKTISFSLGVIMALGIFFPTIEGYGVEKSYTTKILAENQYNDAVKFGDGYLLLKDGTIDNINGNTSFTYFDKEGNKRDIKNSSGFTEIYASLSSYTYYVDYGLLAVGKDNKVALMDSYGKFLGGKNNYYSALIYHGGNLFLTTDATEGKDNKFDTNIWTLRHKNGTIIKEFDNLVNPFNYNYNNGYTYISYREGGRIKLIAVDDSGVINQVTEEFSLHGFYWTNSYVTANKVSDGNTIQSVYTANGEKLFDIENCYYIYLDKLQEYGYAKVLLERYSEGFYENCETLVDAKGNVIFEPWKYEEIISYDDKQALVKEYDGSMYLMDYNGNVIFDANEFAKEFGRTYAPITNCAYDSSTLAITIGNTSNREEQGVTYFFDNEGNEISGNVQGIICSLNDSYGEIYDKANDTYGIVSSDGSLDKRGYDNIFLNYGSEESDIVATAYDYTRNREIIILKNGFTTDKYEQVLYYSGEYAVVKVAGKEAYSVIDGNAKEIVPDGKYDRFTLYDEAEYFAAYKDGYSYILDYNGNVLTGEKTYKEIGGYISNFYRYKANPMWDYPEYRRYVNKIHFDNIAITVDAENKIGLLKFSEEVKSNENPVINVANKEIIQGMDFNILENASAKDYEDGDITSRLLVKGTVDNTKPGKYILNYSVTDSDGNSIDKTITVTVIKSDWYSHWGKNSIKEAMDKDIVDLSASFRPEDPVTRAEFIKLVNRTFGYTEATSITYKDVKAEFWYYKDIQIAAKAGYISTVNTTFRPNDPISREEVAVIISNLLDCKNENLDKLNGYKDKAKVSSWAKSSVEGVIEAGYMGKGSLEFRSLDRMVRAEAVTALSRIK